MGMPTESNYSTPQRIFNGFGKCPMGHTRIRMFPPVQQMARSSISTYSSTAGEELYDSSTLQPPEQSHSRN